ncbi:MarR family winged helix-turn-helix transcriptional regulator [Yinghuangia soli]|uniref:MarR family winged helix-turn-helix transcriptional regulator n=1 Tax=Yinghuangia soli TaxID=2908204 RepID=A0AA41U0X4_9ACTN|nr:MarR family winged helix-turn-helix transcriptional regulator [Yinghuangia soli]MCF2530233.1 MarR family winged helix-turn-helix transcriptional regulator [Yinghuangia soli]
MSDVQERVAAVPEPGEWDHADRLPDVSSAARTAALVARTSHLMWRLVAERLAERGLSPRVHAMLGLVGERGSLSRREIGQLLGVDGPELAALTDAALADGWIRRLRVPPDRRRYEFYLTVEGERARKAADAVVRAVQEELFGGLDASEHAALQAALGKVAGRRSGARPG